MTVFSQLPEVGGDVLIYTHLSIRDDAHVLFGFANLAEREAFRLLIKVNGVGPKMAIVILSGMKVDELAVVIANHDINMLVSLPGIGKKTAERLLIELKDKFPVMSPQGAAVNTNNPMAANDRQIKTEAAEALVALGYKMSEADKMVDQYYESGMTSEVVIRGALQTRMKR